MAEMRLIDANAFARWLDKEHHVDKPTGKCDERQNRVLGIAISAVKNPEICPTIDAVPVVHGRWVETGKVFVHSMYDLFTKCSLCSFGHVRNEYQEPYHYCPNCGAKMDGGAADGSDA